MSTLADIEAISRDYLTAEQAAKYLNMAPQYLRIQAREDKSKLGFPVILCGRKMRVPKIPFIKFMRGEQ